MRYKFPGFQFLLLALVLSTVNVAQGQVASAATQGYTPLEVGAGVSTWSTNWGPGHMIGITSFADYHLSLPGKLRGLGVEGEYRDVNWGRDYEPSNYRQMTIGGGPLYTVPFRNHFRFYGKYLIDYGSMDFMFTPNSGYTHDTRTVYAPGAGAEYRIKNSFWGRVDFEYQTWPHLFSATTSPTPYGFTFSLGYDVRSPYRRTTY
jgi:hypothetical protein